MEKKGSATISDVAHLAGVSRASVSKVIRDAYGVSDEMKLKVQEAIDTLQYRPRISARSLRGGRSFTLGVLLTSNANFFFSSVIEGLVEVLHDTPYQVVLAPSQDGAAAHERTTLALVDRQVDGMLAIAPAIDQEWLESLAVRIPLVMLGRHDKSMHFDTIVNDDMRGGAMAVDHLVQLGHRRVWHVTMDPEFLNNVPTAPHTVREQGYRQGMQSHGLDQHTRVIHVLPTEDSTYRAVLGILDEEPPPTALFIGHDELAMGALRALSERGLTPKDVSIIGYDDADLAGHPLISLTTINQGARSVGASAGRMLLERIAGRTEPRHEVLAPELVVRDTTHPPAD